MSVEASLLAEKLGQMGRDLDGESHLLATFEDAAVALEAQYVRLKEMHEDEIARAFLAADGSVDVRKAKARLACIDSRSKMLDAQEEFQHAKALVRVQQANIGALKTRIDVGRSMLSHEKSLHSLAVSGVDLWITIFSPRPAATGTAMRRASPCGAPAERNLLIAITASSGWMRWLTQLFDITTRRTNARSGRR